ncbi:MAG: hypothetical protein BWK73_25400 [Thiothrix lacustris]|uniref:Uncharacterized protein n=1 Tax=Thiothrix lacustris TaxID=525917 RepID=A0A1Y1QLS4_9GAMM|nr:MAG: hypothetical protein BWK73_25400 [Thiothrix lacustris]
MAGIDYLSCCKCGKRLAYDGGGEMRAQLEQYQGTSDVFCHHCVDKLLEKIEELKKHDRRRR